jgi:hypothetical protein
MNTSNDKMHGKYNIKFSNYLKIISFCVIEILVPVNENKLEGITFPHTFVNTISANCLK